MQSRFFELVTNVLNVRNNNNSDFSLNSEKATFPKRTHIYSSCQPIACGCGFNESKTMENENTKTKKTSVVVIVGNLSLLLVRKSRVRFLSKQEFCSGFRSGKRENVSFK